MSTLEFPQTEYLLLENYVLPDTSSRKSAQEMIETTRSGTRQEAGEILCADEAGEPVLTINAASRLLGVSPRTIRRRRKRGELPHTCFTIRSRKRAGVRQSSVEELLRATNGNPPKPFSRLTQEDRQTVIKRARQISQEKPRHSQRKIFQILAKQMGRSKWTIRSVLRQFDEENPDLAIFPKKTGPLNEKKRKEMRARKILELPLDYMENEIFDKPNASKEILGPMPPGDDGNGRRRSRAPAGLPPYLASLYETPLLTHEQETYLFCKYNYLKHKASRLRERLDPERPNKKIMDKIEQLYNEAEQTRNEIVQANLRLVVSMVKRHCNPRNPDEFFGLVSDGNISLMRAVEKFDYARGNKFSTYAGWAIRKNFARTIPDEFKHRDRFRTSLEEMFVSKVDDRADPFEQENAQRLREEQVGRILSRLDEREQKIIISRFGLDHAREPQTLKEVGADLGVTKERIRQIEARALKKLRLAAREERLELPD